MKESQSLLNRRAKKNCKEFIFRWSYKYMDIQNQKNITELARELRKNQTPSERKLWEEIRKRKLEGLKFLRQKPIIYRKDQDQTYFYIADFYCAEKKLVIELDGKVHDYLNEYDSQRDLVLKELGLKVLRIRNEELFDMEEVLNKIIYVLNN